MDSYYELVDSSGERTKLDGVGTVESAKATAKTVGKLISQPVTLQKVTPIDIDAPPRTRSTS